MLARAGRSAPTDDHIRPACGGPGSPRAPPISVRSPRHSSASLLSVLPGGASSAALDDHASPFPRPPPQKASPVPPPQAGSGQHVNIGGDSAVGSRRDDAFPAIG